MPRSTQSDKEAVLLGDCAQQYWFEWITEWLHEQVLRWPFSKDQSSDSATEWSKLHSWTKNPKWTERPEPKQQVCQWICSAHQSNHNSKRMISHIVLIFLACSPPETFSPPVYRIMSSVSLQKQDSEVHSTTSSIRGKQWSSLWF